MRWLSEPTTAALDEALRVVAPALAGREITLPPLPDGQDPVWWSSSALVGGEFVAKFAWSREAAPRVAHEVRVLTTLAGLDVPFLPEVVAAGTDPVVLVTRHVPGTSLFEVAGSLDRDRAGEDLARFLAVLHGKRVRDALGELPVPARPFPAADLRGRFPRWARPDQRETVARWCDWAASVLASPRPPVAVHADLHGDNQVWRDGRLRVVVDFETVAAAEPEYDLRALPGVGPGLELLTATMRHYRRVAGLELSVERVLAWHLRTALDDALWRSEAGIALPDHRTPAEWVDDLADRLAAAGLEV